MRYAPVNINNTTNDALLLSLMSLEFPFYLQRKCDHDVWMKQSLTNTEKASAICNVQAFVNKLKGTVLEKLAALRELKQANVRLTTNFHLSEGVMKV